MSPGFLAALLGGFAALFGLSGGGGSSGSGGGGLSGPGSGSSGSGSNPQGSTSYDDPTPSTIGGGSIDPSSPASRARAVDDDEPRGWEGPSAEEQLMVELINRARMDPAEEVDRLSEPLASGISSNPSQPLAITGALSDAARAHSEDMDDRNFFAHDNLDGESPGDRAFDEGHGTRAVGENIGWIGSTRTNFDSEARIEAHHDNLWESDGHQRNLMNDKWSEIGVGYDEGSYRGYNGSSFVTENFSDRGFSYLTGVVIDDRDNDDFYDIGEGIGSVRVVADDGDNTYETESWESGGYSLALAPGRYDVTFSGGGLTNSVTRTVTIGSDNVKLDVIEDGGETVALTSVAGADEGGGETSEELPFLPEVAFDETSIEEDEELGEEEIVFV